MKIEILGATATLSDAFHLIGQLRFRRRWLPDSIFLCPGQIPDFDFPILKDPNHMDPEEIMNIDPYSDIVRLATEREIACYQYTVATLLDGILTGKLETIEVPLDDPQAAIPQTAWLDEPNDFTIQLLDSQVVQRRDNKKIRWHVKIKTESLAAFLEELTPTATKQRRIEASYKNVKGGRPSKYQWPHIENLIIQQLSESPEGTSNSKIARAVSAILQSEGIDPPVESQLRARIAKNRK